jgi:hypothetical protein
VFVHGQRNGQWRDGGTENDTRSPDTSVALLLPAESDASMLDGRTCPLLSASLIRGQKSRSCKTVIAAASMSDVGSKIPFSIKYAPSSVIIHPLLRLNVAVISRDDQI